jgi:hypothetical protein
MAELMFFPKFSLRPDRLSMYNYVVNKAHFDENGNHVKPSRTGNTIKRQFHNFTISESAQRKLRDKIQWLYTLARSRYVKTYSGKEIHNFKIAFITLTLPSKQNHTTAEITNTCFNQFLTEIRQRTKMENYVWRLEFQKNGNVHYHIVTDTYIDYHFALKIWNRILSKLGYVDAFKSQMQGLSLADYCAKYSKNSTIPFNILAKRYAKGRAENWENPPSVDVKVARNHTSISYYVSKYFSKKEAGAPLCNDLDNVENSFGLRLWFCSRSLSRVEAIQDFCEAHPIDWKAVLTWVEDVKEMVFDYARVIYFDIRKATNEVKAILFQTFRDYSRQCGYVPAS